MIELIFLGILCGTIVGLIPGIHSNNITIILFSFGIAFPEIKFFVLSTIITQSFVDYIPSIFFAVPSSSTYESVLPAHRLFEKGKGYEALGLTVYGGIVALITSIILMPIFIIFINENKTNLNFLIPIILIFSIFVLITQSKKKEFAIFGIIIASIQGMLFTNQLFPLITGYFGLSIIILSLKNESKKTKQTTKFNFENKIIDAVLGVIGGAIVSVIPGIGNNLAARIIKIFRNNNSIKNYLVMLGSINTSNFFFSFPVLIFLGKARNGAMIFLKEVPLNEKSIIFGIIVMLIGGSAGAIITLYIGKVFTKINWLDKKETKKIIIFIITLLVLITNGILGIITLIFSTSLGIYLGIKGTNRGVCLASIITPVLFFYLFVLI